MTFACHEVESVNGMELILNLAWALLAATMILAWLRAGVREGSSRGVQLIALAILVLILFPVVSVSDDLQTPLNAAEADCCMRRDHGVAAHPSMLPTMAAVLQPIVTNLTQGVLRVAAPGDLPVSTADRTGLAEIDNRPPPAAS